MKGATRLSAVFLVALAIALLLAPTASAAPLHLGDRSGYVATWQATVNRALLAAAGDPVRRSVAGDGRSERPGRRYVLSGLATCGLCDTRLQGRKRQGKSWGYWCSSGNGGCGRLAITGHRLDDYVMQEVSQRPPRKVAAPTDDPEREALLTKLADVEARLARIDNDYAAGTITGQELRRAKSRVEDERDDVQGRLADLLPATGEWARLPDDLDAAAEWHDRLVSGDLTPAEASEAHDWAAAYVESVTVFRAASKGARFNPDRVRIDWRR